MNRILPKVMLLLKTRKKVLLNRGRLLRGRNILDTIITKEMVLIKHRLKEEKTGFREKKYKQPHKKVISPFFEADSTS